MRWLILLALTVPALAGGPPSAPIAHLHAEAATWVWDETRPISAIHFVPSPVKGYYLTSFDYADEGPDTQLHTDDVEFTVTFGR